MDVDCSVYDKQGYQRHKRDTSEANYTSESSNLQEEYGDSNSGLTNNTISNTGMPLQLTFSKLGGFDVTMSLFN